MADASQPLNEANDTASTALKQSETRKWRILRLPFGKKYKVDKFYRQQCNLLENYEIDNRQIQVRLLVLLYF